MVVSGNDAGELLRKGKYYKNGYGGIFKASIFYKNRMKISGSLQIEEFRIKNAPVLAQIISSASIIGLLEELTKVFHKEEETKKKLSRQFMKKS